MKKQGHIKLIADTKICLHCGKYKRMQGDGILHQLCECSVEEFEPFIRKFLTNKEQ